LALPRQARQKVATVLRAMALRALQARVLCRFPN